MRKFMFMCTLLALVPFGMNAQQLKGDLDKDGRITPNDITLLIDAYLQGPAGYQSQGEIEIPAVQDGKIRLTAQQQGYVNGANAFAFDFYREVAEQTEASKSMILSPLSVIYALGLVNNGASVAVQKEIASVLGFGAEGTQDINAFCANLIANAPLLDEQVTLGIANAFFLNSLKGYTLYDAFKADMNNYYQALVEELDFSQQASCDRINAWASEKTHGMIPSVMKQLNPSAISYILNALYFKGTWKYQFNEEYTQTERFKTPNETVEVPMMSALIDTLSHVDLGAYSAVRLPYGNGAYSMTVVLPHPKESLADIEKMLTAEAFQQMQDSMTEKEVELHLPRFETEAEMPLVKILRSLGISSAFTGEAFPYVCPENSDISIENVFQKAKIKVNEEGSEAAAVTVIELTENAAPDPSKSAVFYANRPFLYFITERSTGTIFFMGRYMGS